MHDLTEAIEEIDAETGEVTVPVRLTADEFGMLKNHAAAQRRQVAAQAAVFISEAMKCWHPTVATKPAAKPAATVRPRTDKLATNGAEFSGRLGAD